MTYAVETQPQSALVLGESSWLLDTIVKELTSRSFQVFRDVASVRQGTELDYCLVFGTQLPSLSVYISRLLFVNSTSKLDALDHASYPPGSHFLFYADTVGEHFHSAPFLVSLIGVAKSSHSLVLPGDGLGEYRLMHESDVVDGILQTLFASSPARRIILTGNGGISYLTLAYKLRPMLPGKTDLIFDESGRGSASEFSGAEAAKSTETINWRPTRTLESYLDVSLRKLISVSSSIAPRVSVTTKQAPQKRKKLAPLSAPVFVPIKEKKLRRSFKPKMIKLKWPKRAARPHPSPVVLGVIMGLSVYLTTLIFAATLTLLTFRNLVRAGISGSLPASSLRAPELAAKYLDYNLRALSGLPFLSGTKFREFSDLFTTYTSSFTTLALVTEISESSQEIFSYVLGEGEGDILALLNSTKVGVGELYEQLSLLDADLPELAPSFLGSKLSDSYQELKVILGSARQAALAGKTVLAASPDLLGVGGRRKYLVLFQNNTELRATGGFIGSFAILSFENGKLYDMPIFDVYAADGQLKGHVEPPLPIKNILGEANWYLRDSNWDPDFPTSARRAEWFLKKTLGYDVQGTIAINVNTLRAVLMAVGSVNIPDYNEEISDKNIFERAEYHSEVGFFPGSQGKKEFLSSVAGALFVRLPALSSVEAVALIQSLTESIDTKDTLIALGGNSAHTFNTLGWDGAILAPDCPNLGGSCLSDYAMLVDSNLGVNKANYFINRQLGLDITFTKEYLVSHHLDVNYINTASSDAWPAGNYKNYSRLYLPSGTTIDRVQVGGITMDKDDYELGIEHGKTVLAVYVEVPISSTIHLEVDYTLALPLPTSSPLYSFYWQKQPGTDPDPLSVTLNLPLFLEPELISPAGDLGTQEVDFNLTNISDRRITVKFK